jgi:endonuclease YncB( thermonuclease family)
MSRALPIFLLPLLLAALPARAEEMLPGPIPARVIRVVDGDTIEVAARVWLGQEVTVRLRLSGIDAPELRGRCPAERTGAEAARLRLRELAEGRTLSLTSVTGDKFGGRVLARAATAEGLDLSEALLGEGLARPYGGEARASWCSPDQAASALP